VWKRERRKGKGLNHILTLVQPEKANVRMADEEAWLEGTTGAPPHSRVTKKGGNTKNTCTGGRASHARGKIQPEKTGD